MNDNSPNTLPRAVTNNGLQFIRNQEGWSLTSYQDARGIWTVGAGHTAGVYPGMVVTEQQAEDFLDDDLMVAEAAVDRYVTVPLSDNQFTALVDFTFNLGEGTLQKLWALPLLNRGDYVSITNEMLEYNKITINGTKVLSTDLVRRRKAEVALWNTPDEAAA